MRIAAIDIGTNSIHMIVAAVRPDLSFEIIDREKEMVRLGAGGLEGRALGQAAMTAALQTLVKFRRLADSYSVEEIVAAATSAVREAPNGNELLAAIEQKTGIHAVTISGTQEARLIHDAAMYSVDLGGGTAVVVDIGGGSTELSLGTREGLHIARTARLGVIRLTDRFVKTDPLSRGDERRLVRHITAAIERAVDQIRAKGFDRVIGTSGTILSLGAIAAAGNLGEDDDLHHRTLSAKQLHKVRKRIVELDLEQRLRVPGLDPRRADLIVAGAILLDTLMRLLGAREITLCDFSLREGLVLDFIRRNARQIADVDRYPDIRRRSVHELAERCRWTPEHTLQVTRLALSLFDQTRRLHGLTDRAREWLEYAGLLHDVGMHISHDGHHKHSYYLIKHGGLRGFAPEEIEIIALVARYHRRATPKRRHNGFSTLADPDRRAVRALAAILRVAETLDRSHMQAVERLELEDRNGRFVLTVVAKGDVEIELWATNRQLEPLSALLGAEVVLESGNDTHAEQAEHAPPVPRPAVRGRGHRRVRQDDAARPAGEVAGRGRTARVRH